MDAEEAAENARKYVAEVTTHAKRAKLSQSLARKAAEEAQYWVKACMKYREFKRKWYGLYQHISIGE